MNLKPYTAVAITAVLTGTAAAANYTSTGQVANVPTMGVWCTNNAGQVYVRSLVHTVRVQSTDARLTGHRLIALDGGYNADGTASLQGRSYQQVGTWDPTGTNFTPGAGVWEITYQGVMQTDYSLLLQMVGYGVGGAIEGLRLQETMTRTAASGPVDPTVLYYYSGTINPAPLNATLSRVPFDGPLAGWSFWGPVNTYSYIVSNGVLAVTGYWTNVITMNVVDSYTFGGPSPQTTVADGQTLETRVTLVNLSESATAARLVVGGLSGFYSAFKGHDFIALAKWSPNLPWGPMIPFFCERVQTPDTGVVLSLALTRSNPNVVLTFRVFSAGNTNSALYLCSIIDTPNADPTLTAAEFLGRSGMNLTLSPDLAGAPYVTGGGALGLFQYNDATLPPAVATFDNFELSKYDGPVLGIQRAVQLTWPATSMNYAVESAPTPQGPWFPMNVNLSPWMHQFAVPANGSAQFFRLEQAP